ncbi:hypothetical protein [Frateuria sp.]|uniref:hypothetical protein n=1 Tax=Frateuria sp. TaxID=2211372 RepID=UPI003F7EAE26
MLVSFNNWLPFDRAYHYDPELRRNSMFRPLAGDLGTPWAGLYVIADARLGELSEPASAIYLGRSVGTKSPSTLHDRLWKHCCKAAGHCGGPFTLLGGEPRDTRNWARYRRECFKGFDSWHFSWASLVAEDFDSAKRLVKAAERAALHEYERQAGTLPVCNDERSGRGAGAFQIAFPWQEESLGRG